MKPTHGRKPRTGERLLRVQFANGVVSRHAYTQRQLRWTATGCEWDIVATEYADKPVPGSTWNPVSGGY